jgi:hypothetical protein
MMIRFYAISRKYNVFFAPFVHFPATSSIIEPAFVGGYKKPTAF